MFSERFCPFKSRVGRGFVEGQRGEVPVGRSGRGMRADLDPSCVTTGTFRLACDREVRKGSVSLAETGRDLCF